MKCVVRCIFLLCLSALTLRAANATRRVDFNRDVRPILSENCFHCHGADANKRKAKLRLDEREVALSKGAINPGKPELSELVSRIFTTNQDDVMPPPDSNRALTPQQRDTLREWIKQGASYDTHWAFKAPTRPALPAIKKAKWPRNAIDSFILSRLEAEKLSPTTEAPPETQLRRVSFDLTGLPPKPDQLANWHRARDPYAAAVDELLASPHFGERMAVDWMDVARYADTHGFNNDSARSMWRWRDWVIEAFNKNLPYDQFITEQLAGDLLPKATFEQRLATGFNRNHVINSEGGIIDEEYRVEYVADRVKTTSLAWMGLTMECARCHDHKFDPVSQRDYYRLYAFFNNVDEFGEDGRVANASPLMLTPTAAQRAKMKELRAAMQIAERDMNKVDVAHRKFTVIPLTTNLLLSFAVSDGTISNRAGGKAVQLKGALTLDTNAPVQPAFLLDGKSSFVTDGLPKFDSGKGWALNAWVRGTGPILSTMNFDAPESSQSYGAGVEVRVTEQRAVEVRLSRRWPAYSANVVTREQLASNEWQHVLVACDGSGKANGVRIFVDGIEAFLDVIHDDFGAAGITGRVRIGMSDDKGKPHFAGALAGVTLMGKPFKADQLAADVRTNLWQASDAFLKARGELLALERDAPTTMVMNELPQARPTHVLFRGAYDQPRDRVEPGVPEFLLPFPSDATRNRLGLAKWLTDPRNPLTARVVVNRFWQSFFGTGLVKSVEDLGFQSDFPSHPELLDWLAMEFMESGWDVKHLVKLIVTSATYRQDSRSTPQLNERDPENRLLARGPRQRLTAEMLRDQALALSGLLKDEIGGPPVYPYQPTNLYKGIIVAAEYPGTIYTDAKGDALYRRSLYTFWKRTVPHPTLATFDAPDREVCVARRLKTNTPLQALALMNDTIQLEASRKFAERVMLEGGKSPSDRVKFAFQLATARAPKSSELKPLLALLERRLAAYRADEASAKQLLTIGASKANDSLAPAELAAYANVASLILNLDEAITRN
jgi:hypothetical protein